MESPTNVLGRWQIREQQLPIKRVLCSASLLLCLYDIPRQEISNPARPDVLGRLPQRGKRVSCGRIGAMSPVWLSRGVRPISYHTMLPYHNTTSAMLNISMELASDGYRTTTRQSLADGILAQRFSFSLVFPSRPISDAQERMQICEAQTIPLADSANESSWVEIQRALRAIGSWRAPASLCPVRCMAIRLSSNALALNRSRFPILRVFQTRPRRHCSGLGKLYCRRVHGQPGAAEVFIEKRFEVCDSRLSPGLLLIAGSAPCPSVLLRWLEWVPKLNSSHHKSIFDFFSPPPSIFRQGIFRGALIHVYRRTLSLLPTPLLRIVRHPSLLTTPIIDLYY